jgi:peroxiredoxin
MAEQDFDVVELGSADPPDEGDTAPDFTRPLVTREFWEDTSLSDLSDEGSVLLLFHPMDGAFPATYLWNEVRDRGWEEREQLQVVGLSVSTPYAHKQLIEERDIDSRLFSDPQNDVGERYGITHDLDGMAGVSEPRPAAFLIDSEGIIQYVWVASEWPAFPDYDAIESAIEEL